MLHIKLVKINVCVWTDVFDNLVLRPSSGDVVDIYQREFLALRERLHSAEQENLRRSKELNLVLEEIKRAIAEKQALRDINRTWSSLSGQSASSASLETLVC